VIAFRGALVDDLIALGPVRKIGPAAPNWDGLRPVDWPEMQAYVAALGLRWTAWDFNTIAAMASAFLAGLREGADPLSIPPVERDDL
jgi:hypothetical protein